MSSQPVDTKDQRDANGRFTKGNAGGPGNPFASKSAQLRSALMDAVTEDDIQQVAQTLIEEARAGNVQAGRELLDRVLGKSHQSQSHQLSGQVDTTASQPHRDACDLLGLLKGQIELEAGEARQLEGEATYLTDGPDRES
jgi:hypothetical protein